MASDSSTCPFEPIFSILDVLNATTVSKDFDDLSSSLAAPTTVVAVAVLVASIVFLLWGARLVKPALFSALFGSAALATYYILRVIFNSASVSSTMASCYSLFFVPLLLGLLAGLLTLKLIRFAFFCLGGLAGGASGYFLYTALLHSVDSHVEVLGQDLVFWGCVLIPGIIGALALLKWQHGAMAIATAMAGTVGIVPSLAWLLANIDSQFLYILSSSERESHISSPYVYGQVIGAVCYAIIGISFQLRMEKRRKKKEYDRHYRRLEMPLMRP